MPSPEKLDFATLLEPIDGPDAAGYPVDYTEFRAQLKEMTTENNPEDHDPGTPGRLTGIVKADWRKVVDLATKTLTRESKDLEVAGRLTQALAHVEKFAGLRDGLKTIRLLVEGCWDRVHPALRNGNADDRTHVLTNVLDGHPDNLNSFPDTVRRLPLVEDRQAGYGYGFFHLSGAGSAATDQDDVNRLVGRTSLETSQATAEDLRACLTELDALDKAVSVRLNGTGFSMGHLRKAVQDCAGTMDRIVKEKGGGEAGSTSQADVSSVGGKPGAHDGGTPRNREALFRQLEEAARVLEQMEPSSPVPYLIRRAVRLGRLPFPQLVRALLHEQTNVHLELDRLLGLADETASSPSSE